MKNFTLLFLVFAMVFTMAGCGCDHQWEEATCQTPKTCSLCGKTEGETGEHTPGELTIASVDTENLTVSQELPCSVCGTVLETKETSTGIAPANGVMQLSPDEWFACLATNIRQYGATQTLIPHGAESEDNALVQGVVSLSGMKAAITFWDQEDATILTDQADTRNLTHAIQLDAHFTNDTASEFYMLLMLCVINNNPALELEEANSLAAQIMSGNPITDNGYSYQMIITSVEEQTVRLAIIAE